MTAADKNLVASGKGLTTANKNLVASGKELTAADKNLVTTDKSLITAFNDLANDHVAIKKILSHLNLTRDDDTITIKALTGGVSSNIFHITTQQAQYCLKQALPQLKVAKQWLAPVDRVFAEIAWLQTAATIAPDAVPRRCIAGSPGIHDPLLLYFQVVNLHA